jgi:Coenzyme PQQ synthesis protein D (PqqD)
MNSSKSGNNTSVASPLRVVPVLKCSFIVPTEDRKGIYLIIDEKGRESVYQVDGYGGDFCRAVDGARSSEEIADELIEMHDLPEGDFKKYVVALQDDLQKNGLLSF